MPIEIQIAKARTMVRPRRHGIRGVVLGYVTVTWVRLTIGWWRCTRLVGWHVGVHVTD